MPNSATWKDGVSAHLRQKIDFILFEQAAVSRKPEKLARKELNALRAHNRWAPDMAFRAPLHSGFS